MQTRVYRDVKHDSMIRNTVRDIFIGKGKCKGLLTMFLFFLQSVTLFVQCFSLSTCADIFDRRSWVSYLASFVAMCFETLALGICTNLP